MFISLIHIRITNRIVGFNQIFEWETNIQFLSFNVYSNIIVSWNVNRPQVSTILSYTLILLFLILTDNHRTITLLLICSVGNTISAGRKTLTEEGNWKESSKSPTFLHIVNNQYVKLLVLIFLWRKTEGSQSIPMRKLFLFPMNNSYHNYYFYLKMI